MLSIKGFVRVPPSSACSLKLVQLWNPWDLYLLYSLCFQNLLLGGLVIVVLEKHSPLKVPFVFTSRRCVLGGNCIYNGGKQMFKTLSGVLLNWMTNSIRAGDIRQQSSAGAPYRHAPSVSPQWKWSLTKLDYPKAEPYQRICPLGDPLECAIRYSLL